MKTNIIPLIAIAFASCTSINSHSSRSDKQQVEVSMHKMRTEIEELKHDLNTQQMQLGIYEGKLVHIDDLIDSLKIESSEKQKSTLEELEYHIASIEKKLDKYEAKQKEILADLSQLETHANHTIKAMGQYKEKMKEFEHNLTLHNDVINEIGKVKHQIKQSSLSSNGYIVQSGDSLQRIASKFNTSIDELKELNDLKDDLIIVGQELTIP